MNKIAVLVVNINNLQYTKDCIGDLLSQTNKDFTVTLIDQGSDEDGTDQYLNYLSDFDNIKIIRNSSNVSLNRLWNEFYHNNKEEYLCYLNNDVRLTDNFIQDIIDVFDKDEKIGIAIHTTNSFKYNKKLDKLDYVIYDKKIKQGWDFTIKRSVYKEIPSGLLFYYGDDWLFHNCYEQGYYVAIILSSPIIHYGEKSAKYSPVNFRQDEIFFNSIGLTRYLPHYNDYCEVLPTFKNFGDDPIETIIYIGLGCEYLKDDIYIERDKISEINNLILDDYKQNRSISRITRDKSKIKISSIINDTITKNYNKLCLFDINTMITLPVFINHLPNVKFIYNLDTSDSLIEKISKKYGINRDKSIDYIDSYNTKMLDFLKNHHKIKK